MKRRRFLIAAAATVATAQTNQPIGIGFLGASHSHAKAKLKAVSESPDWRMIGVFETDPKISAELRAANIPALTREELLSHRDIQVIAVESAVRDHARDGMAVLKAGKHLHLEKAPAANMADFRSIIEIAESQKLLLQVGYMWRYNPGVEKMLEAARQGWLGNVYLMKGTIGNDLDPKRRPEWGEFAGGVMYELGCHVIDPLVRLKGSPAKITPFLRRDGPYTDALKDNTAATFEWKDALAIVQSTALQPGSSRYRSIEFHGTNGTAALNPIEPPELHVFLNKAAGPYAKGPQNVALPSYRRYVADFVELARAVRGQAKLRVTPAEDAMVHAALLVASGMAE